MGRFQVDDYKALTLQLSGYVKPGQGLHRNVLLDPIAKFHRGHNPHPELPYLCIGICLTPPDREHVTNVEKPW